MTGTTVIITVLSGLCFLPCCLPRNYILIKEKKTWAEAQTYCRWKYTDLASVRNTQDSQELQKLLHESTDAWIGLHADAESWRWSLEDKGPHSEGQAGFRKWFKGEPDAAAYYKFCVSIGPEGEWSDDYCTTLFSFFCYSEEIVETDKAPSHFIFVKEAMSWQNARDYCRTRYTDLAIVRNQTDNDQIMAITQQRAWIGLYRDSWKWSDGSAHSSSQWAESAPSTSLKDSCVISTSGKWLNKECGSPFFFVCYYETAAVRRQVVRVVLKKTHSSVDMEDLKEDILQEFNKRLKDHNLDEDVKLTWVVQPDGKIFHKENKCKKESCK